jgi:uncharacterized SAM-binding protein YcdF (DUF218 family)
MDSDQMLPARKLFGLLARKERWGLTPKGWLALVLVTVSSACLFVLCIYPFLAVTRRVNTNILVVEGWIPFFAVPAAVQEFKTGSYERIFTTGGPVSGMGGYVNDYSTSASIGAGRLRAAGVPNDVIQMVPSHVSTRDRTYGSALALKQWFQDNHVSPARINVLTEGAHARRTRLLFQEALGDKIEVGIISVANPDYDGRRWWRCSDGVREVVDETVAYTYAKFFFYPSLADQP